ncbi:MAG: hypothetical protein H8F28_27055 [Fibrella sp.]|nr:hypothetical protein [Armatimonadota bacterium]
MRIATVLFCVFLSVCAGKTAWANRFAGEYGIHKPEEFIARLGRVPWEDKADEPFRQIRERLDAQSAAGKLTASLLASYRKIAEASPKDATAQYRWAYAQYLIDGRYKRPGNNYDVVEALARPETPKSHEYARVQFFFEARDITARFFVPVARRLVRNNPKDLEAKYFACCSLVSGYDKAAKVEAAKLSDDLVRAAPGNSHILWIAADCHRIAHSATKDPAYARSAINLYKRFQRIVPPTHPGRQAAGYNIRDLEANLAKL